MLHNPPDPCCKASINLLAADFPAIAGSPVPYLYHGGGYSGYQKPQKKGSVDMLIA
jgi:hypothetical protein